MEDNQIIIEHPNRDKAASKAAKATVLLLLLVSVALMLIVTIGGWEVEGEPYLSAPGQSFLWWRSRMLGGRTNHYGRVSLRFGPHDFK